jgi:hypothetical protein
MEQKGREKVKFHIAPGERRFGLPPETVLRNQSLSITGEAKRPVIRALPPVKGFLLPLSSHQSRYTWYEGQE